MPEGSQNTAVATRTNFEIELANYEPQIAAALPDHIPTEKFRRVVITAMNQSPDLASADRRSLFTSCIRAAQDGLLPDGREAALVIFKTKGRDGQYHKAVQYMPMVAGVIKRLRNSGGVETIEAHVVYEKDHFDYQLGDEPRIEHKPTLFDRGKPIGVYAIAKLASGEVQREVMSVAEVEKVRAVSRSSDKGPWVDWWGEMARKTVIRRLSKRLPMSAEVARFVEADDAFLPPADAAVEQIAPPRPRREDYRADPAATDVEEPESENPGGDIALEVADQMRDEPPRTGAGRFVVPTKPEPIVCETAAAWVIQAEAALRDMTRRPQVEAFAERIEPLLGDYGEAWPAEVQRVQEAIRRKVEAV